MHIRSLESDPPLAAEADPLRATELDSTALAEFRERILAFERAGPEHRPRTYPGLPTWPLPRPRARLTASLDQALRRRRAPRRLAPTLPAAKALGRLLGLAHGLTGSPHAGELRELDRVDGRGPTPSAGGLQALELYLVAWDEQAWLPPGVYHYERPTHRLAQLAQGANRAEWRERAPSLDQFEGGAGLLVLVGDAGRVTPKYGQRALRFLLLEAGHLMQSLCLVAESQGLGVLPLGGACEARVARALRLPRSDAVLYLGAVGRPGEVD